MTYGYSQANEDMYMHVCNCCVYTICWLYDYRLSA